MAAGIGPFGVDAADSILPGVYPTQPQSVLV